MWIKTWYADETGLFVEQTLFTVSLSLSLPKWGTCAAARRSPTIRYLQPLPLCSPTRAPRRSWRKSKKKCSETGELCAQCRTRRCLVFTMETQAVREESNNGGSLSGSLTQRSSCISIWKSFYSERNMYDFTQHQLQNEHTNTVALKLFPVTSAGIRTSWSPPVQWSCPRFAPPTWTDLLLSPCSGSSRYTPSTRSSADVASNTTVSSTVMAWFLFSLLRTTNYLIHNRESDCPCFLFMKLFMLHPMFTRGRVRRSAWRLNRVV